MITSRRSLFGFGAALIAAPAIVRVASLMMPPKMRVARVHAYNLEATGGEPGETWRQTLSGYFENERQAFEDFRTLDDVNWVDWSRAPGTERLISVRA